MVISGDLGQTLHLSVGIEAPPEHMSYSADGVVPKRESRIQLSKKRK